jgi:transcriptional regulator with XRE-family HTH domain
LLLSLASTRPGAASAGQVLDEATKLLRGAAADVLLARVNPPADRQDVTFGDVVARRIGQLREQAGADWTQARLAQAMNDLGFAWQRITVAEVEGGARKVTLEELLGLAALYGVPLVTFLLPKDSESVQFPRIGRIEPAAVRELILGADSEASQGGQDWKAAADLAGAIPGEQDWRPARNLWTSRSVVESMVRQIKERGRKSARKKEDQQ